MTFELPIRTPTSLVFFIAAAVAAYFTPDREFLRWFAYSAFCFFLGLGAFRWLEYGFLNLPWRVDFEWTVLGDIGNMAFIHWISFFLQAGAMLFGFGFAVVGLADAF